MEITLKIIQVLPLQEGVSQSGKAWKSQSYVGETQEKYPRKVCFEVFGEERINDNQCSVDDMVEVSYDLESREYNGRWYTSVRAWKVTAQGGAAPAAPDPQPRVAQIYPERGNAQPQPSAPAVATTLPLGEDDSTDLPF